MIQAQTEVTQFCQQQRDLAQQQTIRFSNFMQLSETLNQIAPCSQSMHGLLPSIPLMCQVSGMLSKQNICNTMSNP